MNLSVAYQVNKPFHMPRLEDAMRKAMLELDRKKPKPIRRVYKKKISDDMSEISQARFDKLQEVLQSIANGNTRTSEISKDTGIIHGTIRNYLTSLEAGGYITRSLDPDRERQKVSAITSAGRDYLAGER